MRCESKSAKNKYKYMHFRIIWVLSAIRKWTTVSLRGWRLAAAPTANVVAVANFGLVVFVFEVLTSSQLVGVCATLRRCGFEQGRSAAVTAQFRCCWFFVSAVTTFGCIFLYGFFGCLAHTSYCVVSFFFFFFYNCQRFVNVFFGSQQSHILSFAALLLL